MTIAEAVLIVTGIVQYLKTELAPTAWAKLPMIAQKLITVLVCFGVTVYKFTHEGLPLDVSALVFLVELVIAATVSYQVARGIAPTLSLKARNSLK